MSFIGPKSREYIILGAGGFAREVKIVLESEKRGSIWSPKIAFASDDKSQWKKKLNDDCPIIGAIEDLKDLDLPLGSWHADGPRVICGVGSPKLKRQFVQRAKEQGLIFMHYIMHKNVGYNWEDDHIGEGTVICSHTSITCNTRIGKHVAINLNCTVGHDAVIEDYCNISPGVNISGYVHIEEGVDIGTGVAILPKVRIGKDSVIGAGAVVTRDIPPRCLAVGVPAKVIKYFDR